MTDIGITGGGKGSNMLYLKGVQTEKLSNKEIITKVVDLVEKKAKTGIANRYLKPTLGLIDPNNTETLPGAVAASSGLDVLSHALESFTAIAFTMLLT